MKTLKIGAIEFNVDHCKSMSQTAFQKEFGPLCARHNVDSVVAFEKLTGKKAKTKNNAD